MSVGNQWGLSSFHAILVTKNWSLSDPDPKLIIPDPDPAKKFWIHPDPDPQHCTHSKKKYYIFQFEKCPEIGTYLGTKHSMPCCASIMCATISVRIESVLNKNFIFTIVGVVQFAMESVFFLSCCAQILCAILISARIIFAQEKHELIP